MSARIRAGFDTLAITSNLERSGRGASSAELHVFSYLACLIAYYDGQAPEDWAYAFTATPAGAPFAPVLAEECDRLRSGGRILDRGALIAVSPTGLDDLDGLRGFRTWDRRNRYLEAACATARLLPLPSVADALSYDPQLRLALRRNTSRELMQSVGLSLLSNQFQAVHKALMELSPGSIDLLVPATLWLTYVARSGPSVAEVE